MRLMSRLVHIDESLKLELHISHVTQGCGRGCALAELSGKVMKGQ